MIFSGDSAQMKDQRVLITGGLGFIGSNLAHTCLGLGARVTLFDSLDPRSGGNIQNIKGIEDSLTLISSDIRNFDSLCAAVSRQDLIFNCAAHTSHPYSMRDPLVDIDVNCKGVINLLEAVRRFNNTAKVVQLGTSTQIGRMRISPVDESHPEFPLDIYSANKSVAEKYMLIYGSAYQMRTTVVRLANVFGPRSCINSRDLGFMNYFIGLALKGDALTVFGKGDQLRNVCYIDDCVQALIAAAQSKKADGEVYFAAADQQTTLAEIASEIARIIGGKVKFVEWPQERQAIEVGDAVISSQKIRSHLGWQPRHSLADGLIMTKAFFTPRLKDYL